MSENIADTDAARRDAFIAGLRACADFFERHAAVPIPRYNVMNVFVYTKEEIVHAARQCAWEKEYNGPWFMLVKRFGEDLRVEINTSRETVCRKVVTGTKIVPAQPEREIEIVEWVCEETSLLRATTAVPSGV